MAERNCWEFKKCGREPEGARVAELGVCPASTDTRVDRVNGGKNGGRTCWALCGTMCGGTVQGTYAAKIGNCRACEFYQSVQRDLLTRTLHPSEHPAKVLDIVLERAVDLELEIDRRMQAEEALRKANDKLNLLSSITRHDMLNKIHTLGLLTDYLHQQYPCDQVLAESLGRIDRQIQDLTEMVRFTSDYQNLGVQALIWQPLDQVFAGVHDLVHTILVEIDEDLGRYEIYADPLLSRVFFNLADNSLRHGGGAVTRVRVHGRVEQEHLVLIWEDDGVGVPASDKERIFEKGHGKNTGLGLFLVREILGITGITIRETGVPGTGARFELVVPRDSYRSAGS